MKHGLILVIGSLVLINRPFAQDKIVKKINDEVTKAKREAHINFLASDELRGRGTGSPELAIAGKYIASQFKMLGLKTQNNAPDYFQQVGLSRIAVPQKTDFKIGNELFKYGSLDFAYLHKFYRAYVYSAYLVANDPKKPFWKAGDKFEETGKNFTENEFLIDCLESFCTETDVKGPLKLF